MAIWQFTVRFLFTEDVHSFFGEIPSSIPFNDYDLFSEEVKKEHFPQLELEAYLDSSLKSCCGFSRIKSWTDSIILWGENNSHEVKLFVYGSPTSYELSAEIDLRYFRKDFVDFIVRTAVKIGCLLYTKNHTLIYPTVDGLLQEIKESRAYSFCANPYEYIKGLKK